MRKALLRGQFHPAYLLITVILIGILVSSFPNAGTDGITYIVFIALATTIVGIAGARLLFSKLNDMLNGTPSKLDHLVAPDGYRRSRSAETEEESAALSAVTPTPNRPLVVESESRAVTPYSKSQGRANVLVMADGCQPDISDVLGRGITFLGMRGSGKTNAMALFLEQVCRFPIPALICDYEEDYITLPTVLGPRCTIAGYRDWQGKGPYEKDYWHVTPGNAAQAGFEILEAGRQIVLLVGTYPTLEEAATVMTKMIRGMFEWAECHESGKRVPALICLDEAQHFLPQNSQVSHINEVESNELLKAFSDVNSRGRKRGLTPVISTQRPAQVRKEAITGSEIYFLMRQTYPIDLDFYEKLIGSKDLLHAAGLSGIRDVANFRQGDALVFEGGECWGVHFNERRSVHNGKTPGLAHALSRYGNGKVSGSLVRFTGDEEFYEDEEGIGEDERETDEQDAYAAAPLSPEDRLLKDERLVLNAYREGSKVGSAIAVMTDLPGTRVNQILHKLSGLALIDWTPRGR